MKTIKRTEEVAFNAISFKDAVIVLPLMDELTRAANTNRIYQVYEKLSKEEQDKYKRVWQNTNVCLQTESIERILQVLSALGFESQIDLKEASLDDLELK